MGSCRRLRSLLGRRSLRLHTAVILLGLSGFFLLYTVKGMDNVCNRGTIFKDKFL